MSAASPRRVMPEAAARPGPRLLWEADTLLALVPNLRATAFVADLDKLREKLAAALRDFQARARRDRIEPRRVEQATEVLAALIDHVVTSMPWGAEAGWQSLGATPADGRRARHGATQRLLEMANRSSADAGMRELIGVALALGFDGPGPGADPQIEQLRAQLAAHAAQDGGRIEHALSPQSKSAVERAGGLVGWLPLWVSSAVVAAALAVLFFGLEMSLGVKSDRLYAHLATLNGPGAQAPQPLPAAEPRLAGALSERLAAHHMAVSDEIDRSVIVVPAVQLFARGNATLLPTAALQLQPVAAALSRMAGRIQVIGHTEGGGERSARYPSDWDLSVDRARAVRDVLRELGVAATRMTFDGRGDTESVAEAGSHPSADDGRVEIVLLVGR